MVHTKNLDAIQAPSGTPQKSRADAKLAIKKALHIKSSTDTLLSSQTTTTPTTSINLEDLLSPSGSK
ncbi:hypothetical protein OZX72_00600 [Bifidobacterium sp. ESL0769]|uniref:hypothetical protein n=1 Tax=Bifidobacterium sp. ESL0769 TaxID=2983229 RepID=UPI0023F86ACC|nr:hypothetical protein [Bifidobacterium sp. ESL0769]WEV67543.1 hypothetical protein OZX72_00600 [Bifidobacterium sp. ESL0769]